MGIQWYSMTAHQTPYEPCRKAGWSIGNWAAFASLPHVRSFHPHCRFTLIYSLVNNPGRSPRQKGRNRKFGLTEAIP
jgi:hypothetical protein